MDIKTVLIVIGWLGTIFYIIAYFLLTIKKISASSFIYHFLNSIGALGLLVNALHFNDNANIIVNFVWLIIALGAIANMIKLRTNSTCS